MHTHRRVTITRVQFNFDDVLWKMMFFGKGTTGNFNRAQRLIEFVQIINYRAPLQAGETSFF
jgi:hypothetical protein